MTPTAADSILIVEDAPKVRALVARTLSTLPYQMLTAGSVRDAMLALNDIHRIRVVIVDFGLPDGNGFDIVHAVRKLKPTLPILMMSGFDTGAGADIEFIQKPFDPSDLFNRVEALSAF